MHLITPLHRVLPVILRFQLPMVAARWVQLVTLFLCTLVLPSLLAVHTVLLCFCCAVLCSVAELLALRDL